MKTRTSWNFPRFVSSAVTRFSCASSTRRAFSSSPRSPHTRGVLHASEPDTPSLMSTVRSLWSPRLRTSSRLRCPFARGRGCLWACSYAAPGQIPPGRPGKSSPCSCTSENRQRSGSCPISSSARQNPSGRRCLGNSPCPRSLLRRDRTSGRPSRPALPFLESRVRQDLPEDVGENSAVLVIVDLDRGIDPAAHRNIEVFPPLRVTRRVRSCWGLSVWPRPRTA